MILGDFGGTTFVVPPLKSCHQKTAFMQVLLNTCINAG
jgi:hypothetical protein